MKKFKFVYVLFIFVCTIYLGIVNVHAFAENLGTIKEADYAQDPNTELAMGLKVAVNTNTPVLCTAYAQTSPAATGVSCTLNNDWDSKIRASIAAVINEAKSHISSSTLAPQYFAAQMAINQFLYEKTGDSDNHFYSSDFSSTYKGLYDQYLALANRTYNSYSAASIKLSTNSLTFTKQGTNYVSNTVNVTSNGNGYNVTTNVGTVNKNGNSFSITIPVSSLSSGAKTDVKVDVSTSKTNYVARNYTCGSFQSVTPIITEPDESRDSATATGSISKTKIIIKKVDSTGKLVSGAKIKIESADKSFSETFETTTTEKVIEDLAYGEYIITEISSPDGYVKVKNPEKVVLSATVLTKTVTLVNDSNKIEITKIDGKTNKPLVGAKLEVQDKDGKTLYEWESTDKPYEIKGLKSGTYYLVEVSAPKGYVRSKEKVKFEVDDTKDVIKVQMKNNQTRVEISKTSIANGKLLPGAKLQIQDKDGKTLYEWESIDEKYVIEGLEAGKYYLVEISAPEGYELNTEKVEFEVNNDLEIVKVEMKNALHVDVPDTLSSRSALLLCIAMFDIALGIGIVTYVKKNKIEE